MIGSGGLALLGGVLIAGMIVQRITGMGSNLVIAPFLILLIGPFEGVVAVNIIGSITAAICFVQLRDFVEWRMFAYLLAGAMVGMLPGLVVVGLMPAELLTPLIGVILLAGVVLSLVLPHASGEADRSMPLAVAVGLASGLVNIVSGAGGLPIAVYALVTGWNQTRFSATFQPFFLVVGVMSALIAQTSAKPAALQFSIWLWLAIGGFLLAGAAIGRTVAPKIPTRVARRGMAFVSAVGALSLIASSLI